MTGILLILFIIGFVIWRRSKKSSSRSISIEKENLDDWYQDKRKEDIQFSNTIFIDEEKLKKEFEGRSRKKIDNKSSPKPIETFRGYNFQMSDDNSWNTYEGRLSELKSKICSNDEIISEFQMWDYHRNYYEVNLIDGLLDSRGQMWDESLRRMRDLFFKPWKENNYDKTTKTWKDFDIDRIYFQTRSLMLGKPEFPIPNYIHLLDDRPFTYCWRLTRDYMKWKGTKRVTKKVFENVVKWEKGEIFKEGEREHKGLYEPLWINWNDVGKVFLQMKTKLKKEDKGGLEWLISDVKEYVLGKVSFYEELGEESNYRIKEDLISKIEKLK